MRLEGKVALISGGARGMGAEEALLFAKEGARVVIGDVLEGEGRDIAAQIPGGQAIFVRLDVTKESDWQRAVSMAEEVYKRLDILVNNAGVSATGGIEDTTVEEWDRVMEVNAKGVFLGTKHAIPAMQRSGGGSIINISSQLGIVAMNRVQPAVHRLQGRGAAADQVDGPAIRRRRHPLQLGASRPHRHADDHGAALGPTMCRELMESRIPLGRYGEAIDVAYGVLYLASDEASFMTGSELVIDGGWVAQ